jgi:NADH-quinone oxidoreductase subunit M
MQNHILSIILFTPLVGTFVLLLIPGENKNAIRWIANIFALLGFLISLPLVPMFWEKRFEVGFKFIEGAPSNWIPSIGAGFLDGSRFFLPGLRSRIG